MDQETQDSWYEVVWGVYDRPHVYHITKDAEDLYSAVVLNLPGAGGSGDTREEAINSASQSVAALASSYLDDGIEVPWRSFWDVLREIDCKYRGE